MMDTEQQLIKKFGRRGAKNIIGHAAALNMPLDNFLALADVSPRALLEALVSAAYERRSTPTPHAATQE